MIELAVDLLLESRTYAKDTAHKATLAELKKPHPVICIDMAKRLVRALGCNSLFDYDHNILRSHFGTDAVAAVLKEAQSHNLQRGRSGTPTLSWINAVLQSTMCLRLHKPETSKQEIWTLAIAKNISHLLHGHTLLQPSWFQEKWGLTPPKLDQFKPSSTDTKAKLTAIQSIYKQSQDPTSQAFVQQLDVMIQDRGNERGRVERDFSFDHVQIIKPKFKIDAKTVAARATAFFHEHKKRKAEHQLLKDVQSSRADRNAAFAARFPLLRHNNAADEEAARHAIDAYMTQRLPDAPKIEVVASSSTDPVMQAAINAAYSTRFDEERAALLS
eukprot:2747-Heterococcus_DN1.PRE.1